MRHELDWLVGYADTDAAQIVYHPNYLIFADRARTSWFYTQNLPFATQDYLLVVYNAKMDFKAPAKLGDKICIISQIKNIGAAKIDFMQSVYKEKKLLCEINLTLVCVDSQNLKPIKMPKQLRIKLNELKNL